MRGSLRTWSRSRRGRGTRSRPEERATGLDTGLVDFVNTLGNRSRRQSRISSRLGHLAALRSERLPFPPHRSLPCPRQRYSVCLPGFNGVVSVSFHVAPAPLIYFVLFPQRAFAAALAISDRLAGVRLSARLVASAEASSVRLSGVVSSLKVRSSAAISEGVMLPPR